MPTPTPCPDSVVTLPNHNPCLPYRQSMPSFHCCSVRVHCYMLYSDEHITAKFINRGWAWRTSDRFKLDNNLDHVIVFWTANTYYWVLQAQVRPHWVPRQWWHQEYYSGGQRQLVQWCIILARLNTWVLMNLPSFNRLEPVSNWF